MMMMGLQFFFFLNLNLKIEFQKVVEIFAFLHFCKTFSLKEKFYFSFSRLSGNSKMFQNFLILFLLKI
jgi:hypothetical protein